MRRLCRTDLYFLLRYVCNREDLDNDWLFERCQEVQENPDGYIDLWARDHRKSTIITFGKTIQDILRSHGDEPDVPRECSFGIFSHSRPLAKSFLRQIRRELESNPLLLELFPDILWQHPERDAPKWSEDDGIVVQRKGNPKESTVEAWGLVDGQPIGKHFTHIVYDDIVVPASVTTPDMMAKTLDALRLSYDLSTRGGVLRFAGTRYHFNDAYRDVIESGTAKPRIYPATEDGTVEGKPVLLTPEELKKKYKSRGPYIFACQQLLNPRADETQGFLEDWLFYSDVPFEKHGMNFLILCDPASEKKKHSDWTTFWVLGLGADRKARVMDLVRDRMGLEQRGKKLMALHRTWREHGPVAVRYEKYGMMADIEYVRTLQRKENYVFDIQVVAGNVAKMDRIKRLVPWFSAGDIILPRTIWYTNYEGDTRNLIRDFIEEEYKAFPVCAHDDMLDSLSRLAEPDLELTVPGNTFTGTAPRANMPSGQSIRANTIRKAINI